MLSRVHTNERGDPMSKQSGAADGSQQQRKEKALLTSNPVSESRPIGVVAGRQDIADMLLNLVTVCERIADGIENQNRSVDQTPQPESLSVKDAAGFMGVKVGAVEHLIKTGKLPFVQWNKQRRRVILIEDIRQLLRDNRRVVGENSVSKKRRP